MGKGGMSPEYFMHTCSVKEAILFLEGLRERQYPLWEMARYISYHAAAPHLKDFEWAKMGKFPWEKENGPIEPVDIEKEMEEITALRAFAQARDAEFIKSLEKWQEAEK